MPVKDLAPFSKEEVLEACRKFPTPFHMYSEQGIRSTCKKLMRAFEWSPNFANYFAVKATPNTRLMMIMKEEGFGADCSSEAELMLAERCGFRGDQIMFTSNNTPLKEYKKALELGAIVNLDDISHIDFIHEKVGLPALVSFRYNPGPRRAGNVIIGDPKEAKFGLTRDQLFEAYQKCKDLGVKRFGLHAMMVSNCRSPSEIGLTAQLLFELVGEIKEKVGVEIEMVNLGGGIGVAYKPEDEPMDILECGRLVQAEYQKLITAKGMRPVRVVMENGRAITGPNGILVSRITHQKDTYKSYVGVDACMANLMRPGMYGAYHHVSVLPIADEDLPQYPLASELPTRRMVFADEPAHYDVVGGLCENNDKFAIDRPLNAPPRIGDVVVIHDAGAHGHSMGFNYNGKLRSAELLLDNKGALQEIRRAETYGDYFATLGADAPAGTCPRSGTWVATAGKVLAVAIAAVALLKISRA